jgi:ATPase subunit of ABC transporter with duplicated ATPase domains
MLIINNLAMNYGGRELFSEVSFNLNPKQRFGIVGANGSGKSTFLRVLSGEESPSGGSVDVANKGRIGFLKQDHFKYEHELIVNVVLQGKPELWNAMQEKEHLLRLPELDAESGMRLAHLEQIIAEQDGYTAETLAQTILLGLGIPEAKHYEEMHVLSGGFKLRVLLAQTLFGNPDILLLDEPTNHLDIAAIRWLEEYLKGDFKGVLLIVSHDHRFLNNLATSILDVDYGTITEYTGNFDAFVRAKELAADQQLIEAKEQERKIAHMQAFVDKFKAKASKARQAQSRVKMIEKIEVTEIAQSSRQAPYFSFDIKRQSGKQVLDIKNIEKSFGANKVLSKVKFTVGRGEKVGIIGQNGIGKSTLLKILLKDIQADIAEYEWGYETQIGYFSQDHHDILNEKISIYEWMQQNARDCDDKTIRAVLGSVLFSKDDVHKRLDTLSGGEAARVLFAYLKIQRPNVLVLDEPTNHLDMESIDALAQSLKDYLGTLLVVSHDRHFLDQMCTRIIVLQHNKLSDYELSHGLSVEDICTKHFDN